MKTDIEKVIIRFFFICLVFFTLTSTACTRSKPEIEYGFIKLVIYQGDSGPQEHFSFFIISKDEDGFENLDELYLYHDREQLVWKIKNTEWTKYSHDGKNWIGTRSISVKNGGLPRGVYRAVLYNKGGESAERRFTYDGNVRYSFPELEIADGRYAIKSEWPVNRLVCYDRAGNYSATIELSSLSGDVSLLRFPSNAASVSLWAEDESNFCSAFTNAISVTK